MRIIVNSKKEKKALLEESEYIHFLECIDCDRAPSLTYLYTNKDIIEVDSPKIDIRIVAEVCSYYSIGDFINEYNLKELDESELYTKEQIFHFRLSILISLTQKCRFPKLKEVCHVMSEVFAYPINKKDIDGTNNILEKIYKIEIDKFVSWATDMESEAIL